MIAPLAQRMRPRSLEEVVGQEHLLGNGKILKTSLENGTTIPSLILWGPPGTGKTTIAKLISKRAGTRFIQLSAVLSGVKDIRDAINTAQKANDEGLHTVLFIDEIHRFNKSQQDAFLPHVEEGLITLIGATTENPSFEIIAPLLSRCKVLVFKPLSHQALETILQRALTDKERGLGDLGIAIEPQAIECLVEHAQGDARSLLNALEVACEILLEVRPSGTGGIITQAIVEEAVQEKALRYDKSGEEHFNIISAFHKNLRGSDPDAALYWLSRMLEAGEDPHYILRRMVRFASEDIGNADPMALMIATSALQAFDFLGSPEGDLAIAQATVYLATAPKSNAVHKAFGNAIKDAQKFGSLPVPLHLRNAPSKLMKRLGYGKGYKYPHDYKDASVYQEYLPSELKNRLYYFPTTRGHERTIKERLDKWRRLKQNKRPNLWEIHKGHLDKD